MYDIILSKRVEKYLDSLNSKDRERIILALEKLRIRPQAFLKRLVGQKSYKFRVGNYRIIVDIETSKLLVLVIDIGYRRNIYK